MKFQLMFKTPDVLDQLDDQIMNPEERVTAEEFAHKFLNYSECVTIEFDTENQTAKLLKQNN